MNPLYWLVGYVDIAIPLTDMADFLDLCRRKGYPYTWYRTSSSGTPGSCGDITLRMALPTARAALADAHVEGVTCTVVRRGGLPALCAWCSRRAGMVIGLCLGVTLFIASQFFVWDVRVTGNDTLTERDVEETLAACGFGVGSSLVGFRADRLETRALLADDRLAWISVNRRGTVAHVQVREAKRAETSTSDHPANIIATRGGMIEWIELERGNVLVRAGDAVGAGELLVSGLYDSVTHGYMVTRAAAKVYARTARELTVDIPLAYEQKVYSTADGAAFSEKSINFFGKSIKFSKNSGNVEGICDTIRQTVSWGLPDVWIQPWSDGVTVGFPLSTTTTWYLPYTVETATRTPAEAEELAYIELARQISGLPDVILLQKNITTTLTDTGYRLQCTLICLENIAETVEFDVTE